LPVDPLGEIYTITNFVAFAVFAVVAMKNAVFWDVIPCCSCKNCHVLQLLVTANIFPISPILVLMMDVMRSSEISVLTRAMPL
jgi:hypothetical protein